MNGTSRNFKVDGFNVLMGTVDKDSSSSIYLNIGKYCTPQVNIEDCIKFNRKIYSKISRELNNVIGIVEGLDRIILDLDAPEKFYRANKRHFVSVELTLLSFNRYGLELDKNESNLLILAQMVIDMLKGIDELVF
jgi:hypothetical protein